MNVQFMKLLMDKCNFPSAAKEFFCTLADKIKSCGLEAEFDSITNEYLKESMTEEADDALHVFSKKIGESRYSCWLLMLMLAAEEIKKKYDRRGVSDELFFDTFSDMRSKALECMEQKGVWGTFVPDWYGLFTTCRLLKFGCLEFQDDIYRLDEPYTFEGITISKGDPIKGIHIPSSGEPFDKAARLDSYRRAWEFYHKESGDELLICECGSWLLFPDYEDCFAEGSNIKCFRRDFDIYERETYVTFYDAWRLFGKGCELPIDEYPERTSLQRAFKKYLQKGGSFGEGKSMLIFDGERLLTRKDT